LIGDRIYLDYAATTPVDEQVMAKMTPFFRDYFGNPSSSHFYGQKAETAVEDAREIVARCLGSSEREIVFTSGGSESDNLAIRGVGLAKLEKKGANRILTTPVEHHAVLHTVIQLAQYFGFMIEFLPVDSTGMVDLDDLRAFLRDDVALVSIIYANNEIGTVNPIEEIGKLCRERNIPFHTDAVQAAAHLSMISVSTYADLVSIGAHKFYGPKGVGALFIKNGVELIPVQTGGGQEFGYRAGTQNTPYIVGLAAALTLTQSDIQKRATQSQDLRDKIINGVLADVPKSRLTGHPHLRLPNHASFAFKNVDGNKLLMMLDSAGYACSSGSACKVGDPKPSDVLEAIGLSPAWALGSLRVTVGVHTTVDEVDRFLKTLPELVQKARAAG